MMKVASSVNQFQRIRTFFARVGYSVNSDEFNAHLEENQKGTRKS